MSNVKNLTDAEILKAVSQAEGFRGFPVGVFDVWVRSDEDEFNKFDDKVYTYEVAELNSAPRFVMVCTGTSNAGAEGLKHFDKYNRLGCAVLKSNVFVYNSHGYGLHKGQYPAYRQVKDYPYYRDGDKDNRAEEIGRIYYGIIGANCHKAGWFSTEIGGWSVACLVRNQQAQYDKWMRFMNRRPLSVVILTEKQIAEANKPQSRTDDDLLEIGEKFADDPGNSRREDFAVPNLPLIPDFPNFQTIPNIGEVVKPVQEKVSETVGTAVETVTETISDGKKQTEKAVTEITSTFEPKNIPAFIPRFGKRWLLALIPGGGFISSLIAKIAALPDWLIIILLVFAAAMTAMIVYFVIKHHEKVLDFVRMCYEKTADPTQDNLIPINSDVSDERRDALEKAVETKSGEEETA